MVDDNISNVFSGRKPLYKAFGEQGEFIRAARTIGEFESTETRLRAIAHASRVLGLKVQYGVRIKESNGMTAMDVKADGRDLLFKRGCDIP